MIRVVFFGLVFLICSIQSSVGADQQNRLSDYEQRSGWQLLFDGESTKGWRNYQSDTVSPKWTVTDGVLATSKGGGDLISKEQYDNFEISLDYRISPGGNSGLLFHVTEDGKKPWHSGPEVQILDNAKHKAKEKSGWLYQLKKPAVPGWSIQARKSVGLDAPESVDATRPAGEWNQIYLRVCEAQCEVVLNGVMYYRFRKGDQSWDKAVAASKFAKFPKFGKAKRGHICLQEHGNDVAFRNIKVRELTHGGETRQWPIDGKLPLVGKVAFPDLEWDGWEPVDDSGRNRPLRFVELTHAGDDRLFAVAQKGQIFGFKNDPNVRESVLFLDISDKVSWYREKGRNEEGLLGLAFHPNYARNGHFFVYYSRADKVRTSRISRFTVSKTDPNKADPNSEKVILEIDQPFHNHNGGSIAFGPDGFLYIGLGDGGDRNDPLSSGQDLSSLLGSILRIDVNMNGKEAYRIPADNPFVEQPDARPEIYAFGFRNVWRLAFDSKTGDLWAADVGQDLWEEINLVRKGGNYGWSVREGLHPFGQKTKASSTTIEPVWEYDHRIGRSITGGRVYRSSRLPELTGKYLYADYVTGRVWALDYDRKSGRVLQNLEISPGGVTVTAFGEDAQGEVYYVTNAANGQCIYRLERK